MRPILGGHAVSLRMISLRSALATLVALGLTLGLTSLAAAAGTLDQSQTVNGSYVGVHSVQHVAQTFTTGITGKLDRVDLFLLEEFGDGGPGDLMVQIRSVVNGVPSNTILASATVPQTSVPLGSFAWITVPISPAVPVSKGTQYAIALFAPNARCGTACYLSGDAPFDPYAGGREFTSFNQGATWTPMQSSTSSAYDMSFNTYVSPPPTPTSESQCKDGGWRNYAMFRNQGECVNYVAARGRKP